MKSITETINLVTTLHDGQYRKKTNIPYISHPFGVMTLLLRYGITDEEILKTALLHDTLEDTKYTEDELEKDFGEAIANYVKHLSEDKSKSWEKRKIHTIININDIPEVSQWVLIADKVNNLEMNQLELDKEKLDWDKFNRGKDSQEWYFKSIYREIIKNEKFSNHKLVEYYKTLVLSIFDGEINEIPEI
jgi:(p)ppGpp synthase/HD superfamily hydrolase